MDIDFTLDYLTQVNTETVTLESVRAHGILRATVPHVRRHQINVVERQPSFGVYSAEQIGFRLRSQFIPAELRPLNPRDRLIDAGGNEYTVLIVAPSRNTSGGPQAWKLTCIDLRIAFDLRDLVTIQTPTRGLDKQHAKIIGPWEDKYPLIAARVQLVEENAQDMAGKHVSQGRYQVVVDRELKLHSHEERVKWIPGLVRDPVTHETRAPDITDVRYLEIVGYRNSESIQELPVLDCRDTK